LDFFSSCAVGNLEILIESVEKLSSALQPTQECVVSLVNKRAIPTITSGEKSFFAFALFVLRNPIKEVVNLCGLVLARPSPELPFFWRASALP
jgi:hypothetical protein